MRILAHLFLPRETNNFRAKALQPSSLFVIAAIFLLFYIARVPLHLSQVLGYTANQLPAEKIVELTNQKRRESGLPPLKFDSNLAKGALNKASNMLEYDYWAHVSPSGTSPWVFFNRSGYSYLYAGENLARDFESPEGVVSAWMASPTHRENILSPKYEDIGIAVLEGELDGVPTTLVVQFLGKRLGSGPLPQVSRTHFQTTGLPVLSALTPAPSPFTLKRNIAVGLIFILILVLAVDGIVVFQRKLVRVSGRNLAHFGFLTSIGFLLFISQRGSIL